MNLTIKQIAQKANVSPQTVSRVINNHPDVAKETRNRIQELIDQLGYQPNAIARSLVRNRSNTLAVIISGIEQYGPSHLLSAMTYRAKDLGYKLLIDVVSSADIQDVEQVLRGLLAYIVDGIIWLGGDIGDDPAAWEDHLIALSIPAVFMGNQSHSSLPFISPDNQEGAYVITRHLINQGYKQIGLILGPVHWWSSNERQKGWKRALLDESLPSHSHQIVYGDWSAKSGEIAIKQLFQMFPQMDAVFACNDQMALGVLSATQSLEKAVPEDLAVAGFDGIPESEYFTPPLTTVQYDLASIGARAVEELVSIITEKQLGHQKKNILSLSFPPQLIIRKST